MQQLKTYEQDNMTFMPLPRDMNIAEKVVAAYQDGWSRGAKPKIEGGDAEYFFNGFNDPRWIYDQADKMHTAIDNNDLPPLIWYIAYDNSTDKVASSGALVFNHAMGRVEKGRGVTRMGYSSKGIFRTLSDLLMSSLEPLDYVVESDTNTMHLNTQNNCEKNLKMPAVGFMPLKYSIPTAKYWMGMTDSDLIFWDGRVSVVHNVGWQYSKKQRESLSMVAAPINPLRDMVLSRLGLLGSSDLCFMEDFGREYDHKRQVIPGDMCEDDSVCSWMKLHTDSIKEIDIASAISAAADSCKQYIEVDVPATGENLISQHRLLRAGFFPMSYMPGYFDNGNKRVDGVKFGYMANTGLMKEYLDAMSQERLARVVIPEVLPIATYVMDMARSQMGR